jgi:putative transposase
MGRSPRASEGGLIYHALNRGNAGLAIFDDADGYDAFLRVLGQAVQRHSVQLLAYCLMPNHFHLIIRPEVDGELSRFMRWLTLTHT